MRDVEINQAKMAIKILSGRREDNSTWPTIRCPNPAYENDGKAEGA